MTTTRIALTASAFALAATLGMTAQIWNPITRSADRLVQEMTTPGQVVNDAATADPIPPCANEDGSGGPLPCRWEGDSMGNGQGLSYTILADDTTVYDTEAITQEMGDALAEGEYSSIANAVNFPWETCRISTNHTWVFCPSGLEIEVG